MASSTDSIDDLLAHRIVTSGNVITGKVTTIRIPGFEDLNESQRAQIIARLQQDFLEGMIQPDFDPRALEDALSNLLPYHYGFSYLDDYKSYLMTAFEQSQNVNDFERKTCGVDIEEHLIDSRAPTPPSRTEEEQLIEDRYFEILARQDLEADGCPPCYPPDLQTPLRDVPEEYQKIILYWKFNSDNDNHELLAQFRDWRRFRGYQKRFERELRVQEDDMDELQKQADSADTAVSKEAIEIMEYNQRWKYQERKLEMERYFLQWTEQQRIAMDPGYLAPVEDRDDRVVLPKAVRRASVSNRRKSQPKAHSVLGEPRISKSQTQKRGVRRQKLKAPYTAPKPTPPAMDFRVSATPTPLDISLAIRLGSALMYLDSLMKLSATLCTPMNLLHSTDITPSTPSAEGI
ncbi:hypothetical protein EG329_011789 [Mollisiaceae sp. DMI_Dod_QoI]|nr:hypothetical protein EG329_011789 [Helotiales sp. DMI_Dod_QoI]